MPPNSETDPDTVLVVRRIYPHPPERIFSAWTNPEEIVRWSAPKGVECTLAEVDLRAGGRYRLGMRDPDGAMHITSGVYREVFPPAKLVYTWQWEHIQSGEDAGEKEERETLVTVEFLPNERGTELVLTHEMFPDSSARDSHQGGWTSILERLEEALAA